ncbi:MAG: DUF4331 domain-containing protein [Xanthomonadales bacterium]|nr:DUF4331 domain-containing protein [Xanthomonadales bacterium]
MKKPQKVLLNALIILLLLLAGPTQAHDHNIPSAVSGAPAADILDFYAFMNPPCTVVGGSGCEAPPEELILALTVNPSATKDSRFSDSVVYHIYFENDVGLRNQIDCSINAEQMITCAGLNGLSVTAPVGEVGVNGDIRVFAGLRDDPAFLDTAALKMFETTGVAAFSPPGVDGFAGNNVLAIVVGIKNNSFPAGSGSTDTNGHPINVQKSWVVSENTGAVFNAGISGSWYNPNQDGQGWVIEMISANQFLFYFYGYDDVGNQLWLLGLTDNIDGSTVTVDTLRFSGMGFGGNFDPTSKSYESVGSTIFEFSDCSTATVSFTPSVSDLDGFVTSAERLSSIATLDCAFLSMGQLDRVGRPMTSSLIPEEKRDAYKANSDPSTWDSLYRADIEASLTAIDMADGIAGNYFYSPSVLAPVMADDRLSVDLEWSACHGVWGFELSELVPQPHTNDCGGRGLDDDVLEELLSMVISGFDPMYDDFVRANDVPFLTEFPFLAAPH